MDVLRKTGWKPSMHDNKPWRRLKVIIVFLSITLIPLPFNVFGETTKPHPYLFYTPQRTGHLKERIKSDTLLFNSWTALKLRCDQWVNQNKGGNMEELTMAYCMTGEKKYAERAKDLLAELLRKPYWDGMDDRSPRWNAGLNTSHTNWIASVTFDGIYNYLNVSDRRAFADRIVELGIRPSIDDWTSKDKRIQSLNNMGHNWWAAVVYEAGIASLAVMNEIPEARSWALELMEDSKEWFSFSGSVLENKPMSFDPAGGFYESVNYASYALSEYLNFRLAYTNAIGRLKMPYDQMLEKTMEWFMQASYPRNGKMMSLNFGDSNDFANADRPAKIMLALGLGNANYLWYLNFTAKAMFREDLNVKTPMGLLYQPENLRAPSVPSLNKSALYGSMGWGMLRNSWSKDATLLAVKSGFTWNHAHADAGSFVLYHNGENLLIDGGDVGYGNPEYSSYFVTSRAHNVVQFNGQAQDPQDQYYAVKQSGGLYHLVDGGDFKYIMADATGPTSRNFLRNYRNFLWIGQVILIIDDVKTYEAGQFDFLLHYADTAVKKGPDFEITQGKASILFRPLYPETLPLGYPHDFPEKMKFRTAYGLKDRTTNVNIPYYVISAPEKTDRTKLVNAIILLDDKNRVQNTFIGSSGASGAPARTNLPIIERFEGNNYLGVRIKQHGQVTEVYINLLADGRLMHRNSSITFNGWETDAYLTTITYPENNPEIGHEKISGFFMANGSYLRKLGKPLFSSLSKVFVNTVKHGSQLRVDMNGQSYINASIKFEGIKDLVVNGTNRPAVLDKTDMLSVTVRP